MSDTECYCQYIDPGFPGDPKCVNCEAKEQAKKERMAAEVAAAAVMQLALPCGDPARIFTDAEIRDVEGTHCDKNGRNRLLLRELRRSLGLT